MAKFEAAGGIAILSNTYPTAFWLVYHLFSDLRALEDCRKELSQHVTESTNEGSQTRTLDVARLKDDCPILLSMFKEVLRYHSVGMSVRMVTADHKLDNRYLLKKDGLIMMPSLVQHRDTHIWGDDVHEFVHDRFVPQGSKKRPNPISFRGFGGGTTLCPARHFATTEIMVFAAMMILHFDITPTSGSWSEPATDKAPIWAVIPGPDHDVEVMIIPRGVEQITFTLSESHVPIDLTAEDMSTGTTH